MELETGKKIKEAKFFLELLRKIESENQSITGRPPLEEATYFTSALLTACESVTKRYLEKDVKPFIRNLDARTRHRLENMIDKDVDKLRGKHEEMKDLRNDSVHRLQVPANDRRKSSIFGESMWGEVKKELIFDSGKPVVNTFQDYISKLEQLVEKWKKEIQKIK